MTMNVVSRKLNGQNIYDTGGYLLNGGSYCWLHWTLAKLGSWVVDRNRLKQLQPWTICAFNVLQELLAGSWLGSSRLQGRT